MFSATLVNATVGQDKPASLARLTIGITNRAGQRAEMVFVRNPHNAAELVTQIPQDVLTSAEVDSDDSHGTEAPTEDEINEEYLVFNGWERFGRDQEDGLSDFWKSPVTGEVFPFAIAMNIQQGRDLIDPSSSGMFANGETALGDAMRKSK